MKKRDFLVKSGLFAAGTLILPGCGTGSASKQSGAPATDDIVENKKKELGIQIYTLRNQLREDLEGTIKKISDIGYTYLEVFGYDNGKYFDKTASEFNDIVLSNGLKIVSGHYQTGLVRPYVGSMSDSWEQAVEDAKMTGHKYMVCAYLLPEERATLDDYKRVVDLINVASETCQKAGMQFCYHNHDFEFQEIDGVLPMDYLLSNTDADKVKTELDIYWIHKAGLDAVEFFNKYKGRVPLWHVKDMDSSEEQEFTEVGNGVIDFKKIFNNTKVSGMDYFFVEQDVSDDPIMSIQQSYDYITKNLI